jgi:hypothetical protein
MAPFRYTLHYRPGKQNLIADLLFRKAQDLVIQKATKEWSRNQVLLPFDRFAEGALQADILAILPNTPEEPEAPMKQESRRLLLINAIFAANCELSFFFDQKKLAVANINGYIMHNDLLVHKNRLMVPNKNELRTRLCDEFHRLPYRAHPERGKMRKIICQQYFWPEIESYINRYIGNCPKCKRSKNSRLKPAGLLRPMPIPQKPWQHITINFKSFNKDRYGYNAILVIMNHLSKQLLFLFTHKICTAADLAELYYIFP